MQLAKPRPLPSSGVLVWDDLKSTVRDGHHSGSRIIDDKSRPGCPGGRDWIGVQAAVVLGLTGTGEISGRVAQGSTSIERHPAVRLPVVHDPLKSARPQPNRAFEHVASEERR